MHGLILYRSNAGNKTYSYNNDWYDALQARKEFQWDSINVENISWKRLALKILKYDLIVLLHSTNSNSIKLTKAVQRVLRFRRGKLVLFVGNEFKNLHNKREMIRYLKAEYVASQLPLEPAQWLYEDTGANIFTMPHALNPEEFRPTTPHANRYIDIGVRSAEYPWYLGDQERNLTQKAFELFKNYQMTLDISFSPEKRFDRPGWANFLNNCKGTFSTESGTSFLERDDKTRLAVNAFLEKYPDATYEDVFERFFQNYKNPVSGKLVSSRHMDAIGTKTCQIMFPGEYSGILKAWEHYIPLEKDFSNIQEAVSLFKDDKFRQDMVDRTYEYVLAEHTHSHRMDHMFKVIYG